MRGKYADSILIINNTKLDGDIGNLDRYLLTEYRIPQRHKFNVSSGDILLFHHIQKTGESAWLLSNSLLGEPIRPCQV